MKIEYDSNDIGWFTLEDMALRVYSKHSLAKAFQFADVVPPWEPLGDKQELLLLKIIGTKAAETINSQLLVEFVGKSQVLINDRSVKLNDDQIRRIALELADELAPRRIR